MLSKGRRVLFQVQSLARRVFEKTWNGVRRGCRCLYAERQTFLLVAILGALTVNGVPDRLRCQKSSLQWLFFGFYQETTPDYQCIEGEMESNLNLIDRENQTEIERVKIEAENGVEKAKIEAQAKIKKAEIEMQAEIEKARVEGLIGILEVSAPHLSPEELRELVRSVR